MIQIPMKITFLPAVLLTLLLHPTEALSDRASIKASAKVQLEELRPTIDKLRNDGRFCALGIRSTWRGSIVTAVSDEGVANGIQPGDNLVVIEGTEISGRLRSDALINHEPGDSIAITIERNGQSISLVATCYDGTNKEQTMVKIIQAAAKGQWQNCIEEADNLDQVNGGPISYTAQIRMSCREAIRCRTSNRCKPATYDTARDIYDFSRLSMRESIIASELDSERSNTLSNISWLEAAGFPRFAAELESELRAAESQSSIAEESKQNVPESSYGTCFAVSDSEVLTSHHVVEDADVVTVSFQGSAEKGAVVLEQSQSTDLALLRISGKAPSYLPLAPIRSLKVGDEIFTLGFPVTSILGLDAKFTEGTVSALTGIEGDASYFQMSVPIQPGNSGGPVVNMQGQVVGIVASTAAIEAFYLLSGSLPQNVNWASKADHARLLFDPPPATGLAGSRSEAIEMAGSAICRVTATRN
jgi:S1-C subfamily serine protease